MQLASFFTELLDAILPPKDAVRIVRECRDEDFLALAAPRVLTGGAVALLPYRNRLVRSAILAAKFSRDPRAIGLLARVLGDYRNAVEEDGDAFDESAVFVPVPLGSKRREERGYNQVELVAEAARIPLLHALARVRDTEPQTSLARSERLTNLKGAFSAHGPLDPARLYVVFDDVTTTGATLDAARDALEAAGARRILRLALAH